MSGLLLTLAASTTVAAWTQWDRMPAVQRLEQRAQRIVLNVVEDARIRVPAHGEETFECDIQGRRLAPGASGGQFRVAVTTTPLPGSVPGSHFPLIELRVRVTQIAANDLLEDVHLWIPEGRQ